MVARIAGADDAVIQISELAPRDFGEGRGGSHSTLLEVGQRAQQPQVVRHDWRTVMTGLRSSRSVIRAPTARQDIRRLMAWVHTAQDTDRRGARHFKLNCQLPAAAQL
jgi:hypothetical protein